MNVKIIKSEKDYEAAMARLSALMSLDPKSNSKEENELDLLALVIQDFERQTVPPVKADPIESILFRMDQMQLTRKDLIPYIGSISKVSEVLSRKRPLSLPMIRRLNQGLGIPADILIEDVETDSSVVDQEPEMDFSRFPLKEMLERGCFGDFEGNVQRLKDYAEDLVRKFMQDLLPKRMEPAFLRAPMHQRGDRKADEMAILAWRMCVLRKAREVISAREYKHGNITPAWLRELAKLSAFDEGPKLAKEYLARHGITLVIEKHFKRTFLDGAAMLDNDRPIVALTLRHDRVDNFWFALLHELAHVAKHLKPESPVFIDDLDRTNPESVEAEADAMAQEALIPEKSWSTAKVRQTLSSEDAIAFADEIGVHPAIVAGRLRHEEKNFRLLSHLIGKTGQVSQTFAQ
ncbi:ImmA/IrrE family metallo-endopeptidase [Comamonas aquatica]|uniref:Predicted transcription regulator containing HTH domain n=1 Tax=Comamonas aquatica TaxID=225991 RepID=A0AA35DA38_9BURK|nr:ImmA/IrrE family metallo-endopeptidase [Comamonas aquatica]CAB5697519.1 Predicted transcription regulator containing HTH domain [Comamonas aquatica]CAB5710776.1 Predicted transcription regulator containing HTH domain [Comamonas aquatica]CAC9223233.1 Predicted transcription regulator containing HTH domain [Comamonas aquatica]CAC9683519.1 Predicted transcription regulator containing HTH domain [Comamonas aquatica]